MAHTPLKIPPTPNTGFSNIEEEQIGLAKVTPFSPEDELNNRSDGKYEKVAKPWGSKVVGARGGRPLTREYPASGTGCPAS
jgi:hypothetical protein